MRSGPLTGARAGQGQVSKELVGEGSHKLVCARHLVGTPGTVAHESLFRKKDVQAHQELRLHLQ